MNARASPHLLGVSGRDHFQPLGIIFFVLAVLLAGAIFSVLVHRIVGETALFDTDEASHSTPALELYVAVQRRDIVHFGKAIFNQSFYPPVHSLTVLPSYLIAGPTLATTRLPTVVTFAVLLIVAARFTFQTTSQFSRGGSGIAFVATAAIIYFISTSPVLIQNAVLSMLELLGSLWTILLLWLCWRLDNSSSRCWTRVCALAIGLLVIALTKYSFGIIAIPAVVAAILTGPKPHTGKKPRWIEAKDVLVGVAVGLGFWFIGAGFQGALRFAFDQPKHALFLSAENLFYYPLVWLSDFHLHPVFGLFTALLACWGTIKGWNSFAVRTSSWIVCFSLLILTITLNNQPRHFAFASPCIWFLAAFGLAQLLDLSVGAGHSRLMQSVSLIVLLAFLGLSAFQRADELQPHLTDAFEGRDGGRNKAMQSYILENVDLDGRVLILGLFDQLNAMAIQWQSAIETGRAPSEISVVTDPRFCLRGGGSLMDEAGADHSEVVILRAAATQGDCSQIVVVRSNNSTDPYILAAPIALRDFNSTSRLFDTYRIDIFVFSDRR